jgi:hypothetical protein
MAERPQRVEIGFGGGQVISARVAESELEKLREALGRGGGWYDFQTEDGRLSIDRDQVAFVRTAAPEHRVGFSGP